MYSAKKVFFREQYVPLNVHITENAIPHTLDVSVVVDWPCWFRVNQLDMGFMAVLLVYCIL